MKVRLRDVAERAGVSVAAASKALNGRHDVSEETTEAVAQAALELGYVPTTSVKATPHITIIFDSLQSTYSLDILTGATEVAQSEGVSLHVVTEDFPMGLVHKDDGVGWINDLASGGAAGLILVTSTLSGEQAQYAEGLNLPVVMVDPAREVPHGIPAIGATNWRGGFQATSHLIQLGHRRIGFIAGSRSSIPSAERLQGYKSALLESGFTFDPALIAGWGFGYGDGESGAHQLLDLPRPPTAIFAACDVTAVAVMKVAQERGMAVPDDLSVIGFDDTSLAQYMIPGLTSVRQPLRDMGQQAVRAVMSGRPHAHLPVQLTTHLVVRESCSEPKPVEM